MMSDDELAVRLQHLRREALELFIRDSEESIPKQVTMDEFLRWFRTLDEVDQVLLASAGDFEAVREEMRWMDEPIWWLGTSPQSLPNPS